jgi:predicted small lipoprotein YifL
MRRASLLAVALLACTLAGCGNTGSTKVADDAKSHAARSAASSPAASTSSTRPSHAGKALSSASPSSSASPLAPCRTADLRVTLGPGDGAAGSVYYPLRLTNTSGHACRTGGFGGVSLVSTAAGQPIGAPADRTQSGNAKPLVLRPGAHAEAALRVVNAESYPPGKCHPAQATGLRIYPPNETHSTFVKHRTTACSSATVHLLSLTPYKAG